MANQLNYKKRIELLRLFINEGEAVNSQAVKDKLLLSESSFFKLINELNTTLYNGQELDYSKSERKLLLDRLLVHENEKPDLYLAQVFQTNTPTKRELARILMIFKLLQQYKKLSIVDILDKSTNYALSFEAIDEDAFTWEKLQVQRVLNFFLNEGILQATKENRTNYYELLPTLDVLNDKQLNKLLHFISNIVYKDTPSSPGYLIALKIKMALVQEILQDLPIQIPYTYAGRILDEPLIFELLDAIENRHAISLNYFTVIGQQKKVVKETAAEDRLTIVPLHIIYDEQYYRWYLIGVPTDDVQAKYQIFRVDFIQSIRAIKSTQHIEPSLYEKCKQFFKNSWCVSDHDIVKIEAKFYQYDGITFIQDRVEREGQFGEITEHFEDGSFLWQIDVRGVSEITPWLRSFGSSCEVLKPASLREQFINDLLEVQKQYAK